MMIAENLQILRERADRVCRRIGRQPEDVKIVAVTKTFGAEKVHDAFEAGHLDFGENYVQELVEKRKTLPPAIRWHFIGHLQSNKAKQVAGFVHLIHSVDSLDLARELDKRAEQANRTVDILVEVHTTDEATKFGVPPEKTVELVKRISAMKRVSVKGLMTLGPFSDDPNDSRPSFREIVDLKKKIEQEGVENVTMKELSMGMSHDFEVGIEEGATIIRIGTAIFGKREKK